MSSKSSSSSDVMHVGMIGAGTVGGGVYEVIMGRLGGSDPSDCVRRPSRRIIISKICVRDLNKARDFRVDENHTSLVTDVSEVLEDESLEMVIEVMGGTTVAKEVVLTALKRGKAVVTANKALVATCLDEIHAVVKETGSKFAYEAAVCGGIPIISIFQSCYTGDIIHEVMGICNGTTNYMLGKMEYGAHYEAVLKEAQELGYAEADPTADVEGHDVQAKIAILAKLAFGTTVDVSSIPCVGITKISSVDFEYAKLLNCTIKLVGTAARLSNYAEHDGPLSVYVSPKVVPNTHLLASATGCGNAIAVSSANLGEASYTGPGAGRFPTANSIVADVCRLASITTPSSSTSSPSSSSLCDPFPMHSTIEIDNDYHCAFYIRIAFQDGLGIVRRVGELAEKHGISINSVLQNPIKDRMAADFVVTTDPCKCSQAEAFCKDVSLEDFARNEPLCMPLLMDF